MYRSGRLVLGRSPQDESVVELAEDEGWSAVEDVVADGARQVLWAVGPGTSLTYTEDPVSHNAYVVLASADQATYDRALELIEYELMPFQRIAMLRTIDNSSTPLAVARSVICAGLGAPDEFDEEFFTRIRDAFSSPEDWVREAAIWATAYSAWPQYVPLLEFAAGNDSSAKLRSDAAAVLEGFRAAAS